MDDETVGRGRSMFHDVVSAAEECSGWGGRIREVLLE